MKFKGFSIEGKEIFIHLDNVALKFDSVEEMEKIAEDIRLSAKEIKEGYWAVYGYHDGRKRELKMIGVKGMDYLNTIWEMASDKGCKCEADRYFVQDMLGAIRCDRCKNTIISQMEVNEMEINKVLPTPNISNERLNNWFGK